LFAKTWQIDAIAYALHWHEDGMDFGDALHLEMSTKESTFKTFDKPFVKCALALDAYPVVELPR